MKLLFVKFTDGDQCFMQCDRIDMLEDNNHIILAMFHDSLVGVFDIGSVVCMYLTEKGGLK